MCMFLSTCGGSRPSWTKTLQSRFGRTVCTIAVFKMSQTLAASMLVEEATLLSCNSFPSCRASVHP